MKNKIKKILLKDKKRVVFIVSILVAFIIGLTVAFFVYNHLESDRNTNIDITFIDSHQAIIFWTTEDKTVGFVRYGESKQSRNRTSYQTSSEPGNTHAVVVEEIPVEGIYISLHNESDSPFLRPQIQRIFFDANEYIE